MATCRYSDTGPQFALCISEWELAETSLLKVMHLHVDRQGAAKPPSAMCRFFTRQKSLICCN